MSTIRVTNVQDTSGGNSSTTEQIKNGIAKAWVNFNGTGVVAIRASFNVSSITDSGVGSYGVNFTNALSDANYSAVATITPGSSLNPLVPTLAGDGSGSYSTTALAIGTWNQNSTSLSDTSRVAVAVFR